MKKLYILLFSTLVFACNRGDFPTPNGEEKTIELENMAIFKSGITVSFNELKGDGIKLNVSNSVSSCSCDYKDVIFQIPNSKKAVQTTLQIRGKSYVVALKSVNKVNKTITVVVAEK